MMASRKERSIAFGDSMEDGGIADRSPIDKQLLRRARRPCMDRIKGEPAHLGNRKRGDDREDLTEKPLGIDLAGSILFGGHRRIIQPLLRVVREAKMNRRPSHGRL